MRVLSRGFFVWLIVLLLLPLVSSLIPQSAIAQTTPGGFYDWVDRSNIVFRRPDGSEEIRFHDDTMDYDHTYKATDHNGCGEEIHVTVDTLPSITASSNDSRRSRGTLKYKDFSAAAGCGASRTIEADVSMRNPDRFNITYHWKDIDHISRTDDNFSYERVINPSSDLQQLSGGRDIFLRKTESSCKDFLVVDKNENDIKFGYYEELDASSRSGTGSFGQGENREPSSHVSGCYVDEDGRGNQKAGNIIVGGYDAVKGQVPGSNLNQETGSTEKDCSGSGVLGWILCPVVDTLQAAIGFIQEKIIVPLLDIAPLTQGGNYQNLYDGWKQMRNIANALFVIVFFVIIFAQASSVGLDAYTVKKMLPKLIIAAILVQFSWFIVSILVDVSNVAGVGIRQLLVNGVENLGQVRIDLGGSLTEAIATAVAAGALVVGVASGALLGLIPILTGALLTVLVVALVLAVRQVLIFALIFIAPLAFLAWVLPNTENLFKQWWSLLTRALMMYPLIMILFAAGGNCGKYSIKRGEQW